MTNILSFKISCLYILKTSFFGVVLKLIFSSVFSFLGILFQVFNLVRLYTQ
ncbi:MAG: hypothetical protein PHO23_01270 [Candidatus Pacebacteria bacterium]|nr:hypothetical protein [Candidatus Paceibacterota bacterium]